VPPPALTLSAYLSLVLSSHPAATLEEMISALDEPETLRRAFAASPYYSRASWRLFASSAGDLRILLEFLREIHDPAFGYNTFETFIEEDVVQAMDQIASERLRIAMDPRAESLLGR